MAITTPRLISEALWESRLVGAPHGPWYYNGTRYIIGIDISQPSLGVLGGGMNVNNTVEVWKSVNGGHNWSECDAANHPTSYPGLNGTGSPTGSDPTFGTQWAHQDGSMIYVAYPHNVSSEINIASFDMTAPGTWGATITGGPVTGTVGTGGGIDPYRTGAMMARRSDGSFVCVFVEPVGSLIQYTIHSGGSWSTPVTMFPYSADTGSANPIQAKMDSVVLGANDTVHAVFSTIHIEPPSSDTSIVWHRSIRANNTMGTLQQLNTPIPITSTDILFLISDGGFKIYYKNGELLLPVMMASAATNNEMLLKVFHAPASQANPVWTMEDTGVILHSNNEYGFYGWNPIAAVYVKGKWKIIFEIDYVPEDLPSWVIPNVPLEATFSYNDWYAIDRNNGGSWTNPKRIYGAEKYTTVDGGRSNTPYTNEVPGGYGVILTRAPGTAHTSPLPATAEYRFHYMELSAQNYAYPDMDSGGASEGLSGF